MHVEDLYNPTKYIQRQLKAKLKPILRGDISDK